MTRLPTWPSNPNAVAHASFPFFPRHEAQPAGIILQREQAPADSDSSTTQTVSRMADHIRSSHGDPAVVGAAGEILRLAGGHGADALARAKAVWHWCKVRIRFVPDDDLIRSLFGEHDQLELLIEPRVLLRQARPQGDCDDFTMCVCALLWELGLSGQIVTIKGDPSTPWRWSHVYAGCPDAALVMDCSHGKFPGWEAPRYFERAVWDGETGVRVG